MTPRSNPSSFDPRLRTLQGKLEVITQLRRDMADKAVPLLLELLCDQSWHVRERAVEALAERGEEVVAPLSSLLHDGLWYTRACAAEALGKIGAVPSLRTLATRLGDDNETVRRAVSVALAAMVRRHGGETVRAALETEGIDPDRARNTPELAALAQAFMDDRARERENDPGPGMDPGGDKPGGDAPADGHAGS